MAWLRRPNRTRRGRRLRCTPRKGRFANETTSALCCSGSSSCSCSCDRRRLRRRRRECGDHGGSARDDGGAAGDRVPAETGAADTGAAAGPDEYGEVYDADPAVIAKALFDASLLPTDPVQRQVALAAFARADNPVDYDLALKCWQENGCDTGTGGELTAA